MCLLIFVNFTIRIISNVMLVREAEEIARYPKYYSPDTARRAKERLLAVQSNYCHWLAESIIPSNYTGTH